MVNTVAATVYLSSEAERELFDRVASIEEELQDLASRVCEAETDSFRRANFLLDVIVGLGTSLDSRIKALESRASGWRGRLARWIEGRSA